MILKICGITNQEDASAAAAGGATAIGFNFYRRSPRYLAPERAAGIQSPPGVRRAYLDPDNKLRASVLADPAGARRNTKDNTPAVVNMTIVPGDKVDVIVAPSLSGQSVLLRT